MASTQNTNTSTSTSNAYGSQLTNAAYSRPAREPQPIIFSVCIPRVFKNITEKRIRAIFYSLRLGFVERVDMVAKTSQKGDEFWRVFVHFSNWNGNNQVAVSMRDKLESGDKVKIVYDNPWFWLINKSTSKRPEEHNSETNHNKRPKAFIDFGHTETKKSENTENTKNKEEPALLEMSTFPTVQETLPERSNAVSPTNSQEESN